MTLAFNSIITDADVLGQINSLFGGLKHADDWEIKTTGTKFVDGDLVATATITAKFNSSDAGEATTQNMLLYRDPLTPSTIVFDRYL